MKKCLVALGLLIIGLGIGSCSKGSIALTAPHDATGKSRPGWEPGAGRILLGVWDISYEPVKGSLNIIPIRNMAAHFNLTKYVTPPNCDDCLSITVEGYDPIEWIYDIRAALRNPSPLNIYDVRGTLLIGAPGDNRRLVNADEYTELFDDSTPPDRNPFKAFAADLPRRKFKPDATHKVLYRLCIPPPMNFNIKFVIDGSWPFNQKDPYRIYDQEIGGDIDDAGQWTAEVTAYVSDWQDNVEWVKLDTTPLGSPGKLAFAHQGGDEWRAHLTNEWGAAAGEYELWLEARSEDNPQVLYDKLPVTIVHNPDTPGGWGHNWGDQWACGYAAATDNSGNAYSTGYFMGTVDFNPDPAESYELSALSIYEAFLTKFAPDGDFLWAANWGEKGACGAYGIATDEYENVYVVGCYAAEADLDPGPALDLHEADSFLWACYLIKLDKDGAYQWGHSWGGASDNFTIDGHYGVAVDDWGDIYVSGHFVDTVDFDPGPGTDYHTSNEELDIFLSKFDCDGNFIWARTWGGPYLNTGYLTTMENGYGVDTDGSGYVYVAGIFGDTVDFDPDPVDVEEHTADGKYNAFLSKFDSAGDFQWARTWDSAARGVAVDNYNMIYTAGYTGQCAALRKYDSSGNLVWAYTWADYGRAIDVDTDGGGNAYVTGDYRGIADFNPDPVEIEEHTSTEWTDDFYLSKFDSSGDFIWVRTWGGDELDLSYGVAAHSSGVSYITGPFISSEIDLDPGPGVDMHYKKSFSSDAPDAFLVKIMQDGYW